MMHFDRRTLKILRYICRHKGVTEHQLREKFKTEDDDVSMTLILFVQEGYVVSKDGDGNWCTHNEIPFRTAYNYTYYISTKGNELIETRQFSFWRWIVPTFISLISLAISTVTLLYTIYGDKLIKVLFVELL